MRLQGRRSWNSDLLFKSLNNEFYICLSIPNSLITCLHSKKNRYVLFINDRKDAGDT